MKRFKIIHKTRYDFISPVLLLPHTFRLRPREGHELRIEASKLKVDPTATLRWHRDVEGNSIATASFKGKTQTLNIESEVFIQKYDLDPHDFLVSDYAIDYPFSYRDEDKISLAPYLMFSENLGPNLMAMINEVWKYNEKIQTFSLLNNLNKYIFKNYTYKRREEEGVQSAEGTISVGSGSCRDFAGLFMVAAQCLGFATRFVSGYIFSGQNLKLPGSTHAWAEVFIPGAGWKGFDPTFGSIAGVEHIATAVARRPELVPPISGSFFGHTGSSMTVNVWVTEAD
ncbi:hypothetical protein TDB9533_00765 [Thalassocella blandensis]|nr:hypothetical protein TDB9533_00765 [Thalassocella blandensis]